MLNIMLLSLCFSLLYTAKSSPKSDPITCGSVVKLQHKDNNHHLHSHPIAWGSGSGQQSVTTTGSQNDANSLWMVKEGAKAENACEVGTPISCNSIIRFEHVQTKKNLHSHLFRAPLSGNQEVSGFGDEGMGDTGDNWVVECASGAYKYWGRGDVVYLKHADTGKYLYTGDHVKFTQQNCGQQCPIMGQTEVSASTKKESRNRWATGQGIFYPPKEGRTYEEDEL